MEKKLTSPEVARMFGVHMNVAERWAAKNNLEAIKIGNKCFRFWNEEDVTNFKNRPKPGKRAKKKDDTHE